MPNSSGNAKEKALQDDLLNEFSTSIHQISSHADLSRRRVSSVYELYVFKLILEIAEVECRARISFIHEGRQYDRPNELKTGPHRIQDRSYTYALIHFPNTPKQALEVHLGLKFRGKSGILTECDVAVVGTTEANRSRKCEQPKARDCNDWSCCDPRHHRLIFSVECKAYTKNINLEMAREFVGLSGDLAVQHKNTYFVVSYPIVRNGLDFLNHHRAGRYVDNMTPKTASSVDALKQIIKDVLDERGYR